MIESHHPRVLIETSRRRDTFAAGRGSRKPVQYTERTLNRHKRSICAPFSAVKWISEKSTRHTIPCQDSKKTAFVQRDTVQRRITYAHGPLHARTVGSIVAILLAGLLMHELRQPNMIACLIAGIVPLSRQDCSGRLIQRSFSASILLVESPDLPPRFLARATAQIAAGSGGEPS